MTKPIRVAPQQVAQQYRVFLLAVAALIFAATPLELWLVDHLGSVVQLIPLGLCALGLCCVTAASLAPSRTSLLALRVAAVAIVLGSGFGVYEHVAHNLAFAWEIHPEATTSDVLWDALGGASPLLAPGILALGAALAAASTYQHPKLRASEAE